MNKYRQHSRANLSKNLQANMKAVLKVVDMSASDEFDDDHKESLDVLNERISSSFKVARQMHEILHASNLSTEGRESAMQFLRVLVNRFDVKIGGRAR